MSQTHTAGVSLTVAASYGPFSAEATAEYSYEMSMETSHEETSSWSQEMTVSRVFLGGYKCSLEQRQIKYASFISTDSVIQRLNHHKMFCVESSTLG